MINLIADAIGSDHTEGAKTSATGTHSRGASHIACASAFHIDTLECDWRRRLRIISPGVSSRGEQGETEEEGCGRRAQRRTETNEARWVGEKRRKKGDSGKGRP